MEERSSTVAVATAAKNSLPKRSLFRTPSTSESCIRSPKDDSDRKSCPISGSEKYSGLPKSSRILSKKHFRGVMRAQTKQIGNALIIHYRRGTSRQAKLGLTVSKKYGNACRRNRFKRLVREAFRLQNFPPDLEINVQPRFPIKPLTLQDVFYELSKFRAEESSSHH